VLRHFNHSKCFLTLKSYRFCILRRDFRLLVANTSDPSKEVPQASIWHAYDVDMVENMKYRIQFETPLDGHWRAFFVQVNKSA